MNKIITGYGTNKYQLRCPDCKKIMKKIEGGQTGCENTIMWVKT